MNMGFREAGRLMAECQAQSVSQGGHEFRVDERLTLRCSCGWWEIVDAEDTYEYRATAERHVDEAAS